jgi:hypothetical protein
MIISKLLNNLEKKANFDTLISVLIKKISLGINKYSKDDIKKLGNIIKIINSYNDVRYKDKKVAELNQLIANSFKNIMINIKAQDIFLEVLFFYPVPVIDLLLKDFPKNEGLIKIKNLILLLKDFSKEEIVSSINKKKGPLNNKVIKASAKKADLIKSKHQVEDFIQSLTDKRKANMNEYMSLFLEKKEQLEKEIAEKTRLISPFVNSDFSKEEIEQWVEEIDDKGLLSENSLNKNDVLEYINQLVVNTKKNPLNEASLEEQIKINNNEEDCTIESFKEEAEEEIESAIIDDLPKEEEKEENNEKDISTKPIVESLYNSDNVLSDIKNKHKKKGSSI